MWKKIVAILALIIVAIGLIVIGLGGGAKSVATSDAGSISQNAFYKELKNSSTGQQTLANMVIKKVLTKPYGKEVKTADIDKQYDTVKKQYGDSFASTLQQNGMTEASFRENLELQALEKAAVKNNSKFTTKELKKAYKAYTPNVTVSVITSDSEDNAKAVITQLEDGKKFATVAKAKSTDTATKAKGGKMSAFDSTSTTVDATVQAAAFKLKKGEYTKSPIKVEDASTGTTTYYVIKMDSRTAKKSFAKLKNKMKDILTTTKMSDTTTVQAIIGDELNKAHVTIKDADLKSILSTYLQAAETAKESSEAAKKASSAAKKSSADKSSSSKKGSSTKSSSTKDASSSSSKKSSSAESSSASSK